MIDKVRRYGLWVVFGLATVAITVLWIQLQAAEGAIRERDLARDSLEVMRDSTRELTEQVTVLEDSTRLFQRRVLQSEMAADSLDRELGVTTVALQQARVHISRLEDSLVSTEPVTEDEEGVRHASIQLEPPPFEGDVSVAVPAPPDSARWAFDVGIIPFDLEMRVSCADLPDDTTIRPASVTFTTPNWISATLSTVEQDPEVCNPIQTSEFSLFSVNVPPGIVFGGTAGAASGFVVGGDPEDAVIGAGLGAATGWMGEKLLRGLSSIF